MRANVVVLCGGRMKVALTCMDLALLALKMQGAPSMLGSCMIRLCMHSKAVELRELLKSFPKFETAHCIDK